MAKYDERGRELPDPTPVEMPLHFKRPKPLNQLVQELIRNEMSQQAAAEGEETFEEADDFDVEDELFPVSPHELSDFQESFHYVADKGEKKEENGSTVNFDRVNEKVEVKDGGSVERGKAGGAVVDGRGVEDGDAGVGADGKERAASGGKRGSA